MGLRPLEIFLIIQCGDRLQSSESDVYRRQTSTDVRNASKRARTRKNAQEVWWHCSGRLMVVVGHPCSPITGHSTINVGLHWHAEIGLSTASDIHHAHPLNTACRPIFKFKVWLITRLYRGLQREIKLCDRAYIMMHNDAYMYHCRVYSPSKHEKKFVHAQHVYNVGPTSSPLPQHCINVIEVYRCFVFRPTVLAFSVTAT